MSSEFAKDKATWTKSMNLELAKFMEAKPNIWDPKHPKFSHIGLRDEAFAEFAAIYDDLSWQAVKDRWTNIRSTFGFYMRKINTRKENGGDFKVGWFMWKPLKYLYKVHKYAKPKTTTEQVTEQVSPQEKKNYRNGQPWRVQDRPEQIQTEESSSQDAVMANDNENDVSNDAVFSDNSEEQKDNVTCQGIVNNIAVVFKGVQNEDFEAMILKSKYAAVGEAVTTMLSQLNSYEAARMSQKITEILAEYDEKNPVNPNDLSRLRKANVSIDKKSIDLLPLLKSTWDEIHSKQNVFRYKIDDLKERIVDEMYLLQLNPNRAMNRRTPELISNMKQPFNGEKFNFTKVSEDEIMFSVGKTAHDLDLHSFVVNVSPISRYHTLFCPFINKKLPQNITEESLHVVIQVILVAKNCDFKVGFNSLCALASVNHLHFHLFLEHNALPVEKVEWKPLHQNLCYLPNYPVPAFCFKVTDNSKEIAEVYRLIKYLQDESIAHNIFMKITATLDSVEVYMFPRKSAVGVKQLTAFNVAVLELCGWFPVFSEEAFNNLKSEDLGSEIMKWKYCDFDNLLETLPKLLYEAKLK